MSRYCTAGKYVVVAAGAGAVDGIVVVVAVRTAAVHVGSVAAGIDEGAGVCTERGQRF